MEEQLLNFYILWLGKEINLFFVDSFLLTACSFPKHCREILICG